MKLIIGLVLGFIIKMSLYEISNLRYQNIYKKAVKNITCQNHKRSPHICASEITDNDQYVILLYKLDSNLNIWECDYPFTKTEDKTWICSIL